MRRSRRAPLTLLSVGTLLVLGLGCATTNRSKTFLSMAVAGAGGGGIGALTAPANENRAAHATLWAGVSTSLVAVAGLLFFDEQKRADEFERQNLVLRKELTALREGGGWDLQPPVNHEPRLLYETNAPFGKEIPTEYQALVKPGRWSVFYLNQWVTPGEGVLIHQDRMVRLSPPQLNPNLQDHSREGVGASHEESEKRTSRQPPADVLPKKQKGNES